MSLAGERLGNYHLLRLLGSGGMGEVYLAEDARIGQQVAIKVIRSEGIAYPESESAKEAARLFEREAKAIARLDHPNILSLYAYGEEMLGEQQLIYLVMPYRREGTLATWLRQRDALLTPAEVAPLVRQAAEALQHAHNQHVIHQDIKPTNFLIRLRPDQPTCPDLLLADFGIAQLTSATASASQSVRGTPTYMAPEQWDGHPVEATDQYALAIMVYELLVGHPPFQGGPGQVMRQHYMMSPPVPSTLNPRLSPALDAVLLRALAKPPGERFPSVTAFARAFEEASISISAQASPLPLPQDSTEPTAVVSLSKTELPSTEFPIPTANSGPLGITAGPDGNFWFTEWNGNKIGRITSSGSISEFPVPTAGCDPNEIPALSDGNLWFTEWSGDNIGRISPNGAITEFPVPIAGSGPAGITVGLDGDLWFTEFRGNQIGRISPYGNITEFPVPTADSGLNWITAGPNGNLWFTEDIANKIGRITSGK